MAVMSVMVSVLCPFFTLAEREDICRDSKYHLLTLGEFVFNHLVYDQHLRLMPTLLISCMVIEKCTGQNLGLP
jgi:hypothetical protein